MRKPLQNFVGQLAKLDPVSSSLYLLSSLALLLGLLHHHLQIITTAVPLDYYEGTQTLITGIIAAGNNPYTLAFQPMNAYVYPPLYNIIAAPLTTLFGNSLQFHRALAGLFILACCCMCYWSMRHHQVRRPHAVAASCLLYAALLYYATPAASTNGTGEFFFLATVLIPWLGDFSRASLCWSLLCAILAFYAKQYFAVGAALVCLYLFLSISIHKALLYGLAFTLSIVASLFMVHLTSPYFLDNTFFAVQAAAQLMITGDAMLLQLARFATIYSAFFVLIGLSCVTQFRHRDQPYQLRLNLREWNRPLTDYSLDYFWFCFACTTLVIVFLLGHNPANWMTYLFQLMSPFLLIAGFHFIQRAHWPGLATLPFLLFTFYSAFVFLPADFSYRQEPWQRVEAIIADKPRILASPMLTGALVKQGREVFQDGHTFYFPLAVNKPALMEKSDTAEQVQSIWDDYLRELFRRVQAREFDVVLATAWDINGFFTATTHPDNLENGEAIFRRHYQRDKTLRLSMTDRPGAGKHFMQVWLPKQDPED